MEKTIESLSGKGSRNGAMQCGCDTAIQDIEHLKGALAGDDLQGFDALMLKPVTIDNLKELFSKGVEMDGRSEWAG